MKNKIPAITLALVISLGLTACGNSQPSGALSVSQCPDEVKGTLLEPECVEAQAVARERFKTMFEKLGKEGKNFACRVEPLEMEALRKDLARQNVARTLVLERTLATSYIGVKAATDYCRENGYLK